MSKGTMMYVASSMTLSLFTFSLRIRALAASGLTVWVSRSRSGAKRDGCNTVSGGKHALCERNRFACTESENDTTHF